VNAVKNLWIPYNAGKLLNGWKLFLLRSALFHAVI
jgi:hypothetical protein